MAIKKIPVPFCDQCGEPWLPKFRMNGDSNPIFDHPEQSKRCGKCKSTRWNSGDVDRRRKTVQAGSSSHGSGPEEILDPERGPSKPEAASSILASPAIPEVKIELVSMCPFDPDDMPVPDEEVSAEEIRTRYPIPAVTAENVALNEEMESRRLVFVPLDPQACADVEAAHEANRLASYVKLVPEQETHRTRCKHMLFSCPECHQEAH